MLDETNMAVLEQEPTAIENEAVETKEDGPVSIPDPSEGEATAETEEVAADDSQGELSQPEFVEIDYNGKKYSVPAELKDGIMMQSAFTQKTQAVAEERKAVEAMRAEVEQLRNVSQEEMNIRAQAVNLDSQLQQYANVDWQALLQEDPFGFQEHRLNHETLMNQRQQVGQYLQNANNTRSAQAQQETVKRLQETYEYAEKNITGWSPEVDSKLTDWALNEMQIPKDTLLNAYSPMVYGILYKAFKSDLAEKISAGKVAPPPKPSIKPLSTVAAKANANITKDPSEMSMAEYDAFVSRKGKGK
jgi:hypothetical protein